MPALSAFAAGLVFGIGLIVSGMTDPSKIIGFLDLAGLWDPSLAFVMVGAILVGFVGYRVAPVTFHAHRSNRETGLN